MARKEGRTYEKKEPAPKREPSDDARRASGQRRRPQFGPHRRGICTRVYTRSCKTSNSAPLKMARVRLTNGIEVTAYVLGDGPSCLQEHSVAFIRAASSREDLPGVHYEVMHGALHTAPIPEIKNVRSKNGIHHVAKEENAGEPRPSAVDATRQHVNDTEVELTRKIFDVIGPVRATEWMHSEVPSLRNRTPLSLMGTIEGREEVERVLGRIEHGIF